MDRTERIHKIDQMLTARGTVSTADFLADLEISAATLKRDLEYMKSRLNAPIMWNREYNGYCFDKTQKGGPKYELPGLWFNDSELHALMTMQELLHNVQPGLLEPHLQPLRSKLQAILASLKDSPQEIEKRVRIFAAGRRRMPVEYFETVATATIRRKRLQIAHFNRATNENTERIVSPQQIVYYRDNWYLDCWCHMRKAIRSFSIDAIKSAELLADNAKDISLKKLREELSRGYGIFSGDSLHWAKLKISPSRARWVAHINWHAEQKAYFDDEGYYLLEIPFNDDRELMGQILTLMPDVEIIEPSSLRSRLHEVLEASLQKLAIQ
jgi:predicted DNA-binding transcriptional regulator YafY